MPLSGCYKKALLAGAFFILCLLSSVVFAQCASERYDEVVTIEKVHDGDTVNLTDGRKLRLIGINTPELARDDRPAEAYAVEAKEYLQTFTEQSRQWQVRWGKQLQDKYGRWLGHVFIGDKNLNAEIIRQGLGSVIAIPPNQWALSCYQQQERQARNASKGIWGKPGIKVWQVASLPLSLKGFQFIQGKVDKIISTRKSLWLVLSPQFSIRIARDDLQYFDQRSPYHWVKQKIEVRGWVNFHQGRLQIRVRHPAAIRLIDEGKIRKL